MIFVAGAEDYANELCGAKNENVDLILQKQALQNMINGLRAELVHETLQSSHKTSEIMSLRSTLAGKEQLISHQNVQIEDLKGRVFTFAANAVATDTTPEDH